MTELKLRIIKKLQDARKLVFMGVGEEKLSDDGVGPYIVSELLKYSDGKFLFINAGIDPMSRIDEIIEFQASNLILIDTCTLKKPAGTIAIIERKDIKESVPISSHTIPIHIFIDLLIEKLPDLNIFMIGIVPKSLEGFEELKLYKDDQYSLEEKTMNVDIPFFEFNLTKTIQKVADKIILIIKEIIREI
ncbi:MAG: hydrogenase maturation protease [Promethearchaeota archaeon]